MKPYVAITLFLASFSNALSLTKANDFDANGAKCVLPMRENVSCPVVCVPDIGLCPSSVIPAACENGFYCPDGTCKSGPNRQQACKDAVPICSCDNGFSQSSNSKTKIPLYPCSSNYSVNVRNYPQTHILGDLPLIEKCRSSLELKSVVDTKLGEHPVILYCKPKPVPKLSFFEGALYLIVILELILICAYEIYRSSRKAKFTSKNRAHQFKYMNSVLDIITEDEKAEYGKPHAIGIRMSGYKVDKFGTIVQHSVIFMGFFWFITFAILIMDYYGWFAGINYRDQAMLFIDQKSLSIVFIAVWHLAAVWLITLYFQSTNLLTYFLAEETLEGATHVLVEKKTEVQSIVSQKRDWVLDMLNLERYFFSAKNNSTYTLVKVQHGNTNRKYVEFECVRYNYNAAKTEFVPHEFNIGSTNTDLHYLKSGLTSLQAFERADLVGTNQLAFRQSSWWKSIKEEFSSIFYIYQLMLLLTWYFYSYYFMAFVATVIIIISGLSVAYLTRLSQAQILEMATFRGVYTVLRDGKWKSIISEELVPGDIIELSPSDSPITTDCVILSGTVVVDESTLTGEALPITKSYLPNDTQQFNPDDCHSNSIYAGCKLLEVKPSNEDKPAIALVINIGARTAKGTLIRGILFPSTYKFTFTEHLKIVFSILILWGIILLFIGMAILDSSVESWFFGMATISQVLSPLLPTVLSIGQAIAGERLRKKKIACWDLNRITVAGKVRFFCFDKTGTLTKDHLQFLGAQGIDAENQFEDPQVHFDSFSDSMKHLGDKHVGNFVDTEMFRITRALLRSYEIGENLEADSLVIPEPSTAVNPLKIMRKFEFSHKHAYMSVVVSDTISGKKNVFLKGSFQRIKEIVDPTTLPENSEEMIHYHSSRGFYVIAAASCELPAETSNEMILRWPREFLEKNACFVGFMLFRNEIKEDTPKALSLLREGGCNLSMLTGDNVDTAIYIGWTSGMIKKGGPRQAPVVVVGDVIDQALKWRNLDDDTDISESVLSTLIQRSRRGFRPIEIAITGKAFKQLSLNGWLQQNLLEVRIFAGMKPDDKVKCVRLFMEKGITAMCGDGGNDAGALKTAHSGIALTPDNNSSVVGHFSATDTSIMTCVHLLKEGRCALDVSFASYRYLMLYGEIAGFVGMIQYFYKTSVSQALYILIDITTIPLSWAISSARPAKKLANSRPTAKLLGYETVSSVIGQLIIDIIFMAIAISSLTQAAFYKCHAFAPLAVDMSHWWELADNYEASLISIFIIFQIFSAAAAINIGSRYRQGSFKNWTFIVVFLACMCLISYIILADPNPLGCLFRINCGTKESLLSLGYTVNFEAPTVYHSEFGHNVFPRTFRNWILGTCISNLLVLLAWEGIFIQGPVRRWLARKRK